MDITSSKNPSKFSVLRSKLVQQILYDKFLLVALASTIIINDLLIAVFTMGGFLGIKQLFSDVLFLLFLMILVLITPRKRQALVIFIFMFLFSFIAMSNFIYFQYYGSFLTFTQAQQAPQLGGVYISIIHLLNIRMIFFFVLPVLSLIWYKKKLKYIDMAPIHNRKKSMLIIMLGIAFSLVINIFFVTSSDLSRLKKLWNRELVVDTFGIYTYQISDAVNIISNAYFTETDSKEVAQKSFNEHFANKTVSTNEYTGKYAGKNVIYIHYESFQNFVLDEKIGEQEISPFINKLAKESIYFSNFNAQESFGTSSDTEFTSTTSLLPIPDRAVFNIYSDRTYVSTPSLLNNIGYDTMVFHGNKGQFWNRKRMLASLGYSKFFDKEYYKVEKEDFVGLGISDMDFYDQSVEILATEAAKDPNPFYAEFITLSNHHPFTDSAALGKLDLKGYTDESMSLYLQSVNYADAALETFFTKLDSKGLLDNTVVVIYGDHDAKLPKSSYNSYVNYDFNNDIAVNQYSEQYVTLNAGDIRNFKEVPLLIWTKDKAVAPMEVTQVSGMVDVQPTILNLLGLQNKYQIGEDLLMPKQNITVFPDGSWKNNETYYDLVSEEYYGVIPTDEQKLANAKYVKYVLNLSKNIIYHDLLKNAK